MKRDQAIGWAIFALCAVILIGYLVDVISLAVTRMTWSPIYWFFDDVLGWHTSPEHVLIWLIAIPVIVAFSVVLAIGAWIGWTMATTPPPVPIEELEAELAEEAEEEKAEEEE